MKNKFWSRAIALQAVLLVTSWNNLALCSPTNNNLFSQGVNSLNAKRYADSAACFAKVAQANPKNALAHCYLAVAFVRLGRFEEARTEFFASYCLDPDGPTGKYAKSALAAFQVDAANGKPINARALEEDENFKKTLSIIYEQAQREKDRKASAAESMISGVAARAEAQVSHIRSSSVQSTGMSPYVGLSDNQSGYQPNSAAARAEESIRIARLAAKQKCDDYRSWSNVQSKKIEDIAHNLETQLKDAHLPGQALLKPQGTGFYVRYYGPTDQRQNTVDVHPAVVRILDPSSTSYRGEEAAQEAIKFPDAVKKVTGQVLTP
jgi:tetratricopeptide (TPR) repeat protein